MNLWPIHRKRMVRKIEEVKLEHPPMCDPCYDKRRAITVRQGEGAVGRTVFSGKIEVGLCSDCGAVVWDNRRTA